MSGPERALVVILAVVVGIMFLTVVVERPQGTPRLEWSEEWER